MDNKHISCAVNSIIHLYGQQLKSYILVINSWITYECTAVTDLMCGEQHSSDIWTAYHNYPSPPCSKWQFILATYIFIVPIAFCTSQSIYIYKATTPINNTSPSRITIAYQQQRYLNSISRYINQQQYFINEGSILLVS